MPPGKPPHPDRIYLGDCTEVMHGWPPAIFDACITDPPYGMGQHRRRTGKQGGGGGLGWAFSRHVTVAEAWDQFPPTTNTQAQDPYLDFTLAWLGEAIRLVRPGGNLLIFGSFHNIYLIGFALQRVFDRRLLQQITWFKPNAQPNITCRLLTESTEYVLWACNETPRRAKRWTFNYDMAKRFNTGRQLRNMWSIPRTSEHEKRHGRHPTQKPLALAERLVHLFTKPTDRVLDCFVGSGTIAVACTMTGRHFVGIEQDPQYARIAQRRLAAVGVGWRTPPIGPLSLSCESERMNSCKACECTGFFDEDVKLEESDYAKLARFILKQEKKPCKCGHVEGLHIKRTS